MIPLTIFICAFFQVLAKSFQQLNVVGYKWLAIPAFRYIMAYSEYAWIALGSFDAINNGFHTILLNGFSLGTGGWMGAWLGMYLHKRVFP